MRFNEFEGDWSIKPLGSESNHISYGLTVRPEFVEEGIPLISAREITTGVVNIDKGPKISQEEFNKLSDKAKPKQGDVFLTKTGTIGLSARFMLDIPIAITQNIAVIRLNDEKVNSPVYLIQYFKTRDFYRSAISRVNQSTIMDLQLGDIRKLLIPFPALPEQKKIASFLTAVDEKIQQLTKKKELLGQYKKGVMQQLFSGQLRFKDKNGNPYPDWEEKRLGEIADVTKLAGFEFTKHIVYRDKGEIIALRGLNIKNNTLDLNQVKYIDDSDFSKLNRSKLFIGDLIYTYVGTIGEVAIIEENDRFYLAPNVSRIRFNEDECLAKFSIQYFINPVFKEREVGKYISSSSQPALSMTNIRKFKISLPSIPEQQKIANFLSGIDTKIEAVSQQIAQTQSFKKGLLQQMFV
ncbi:restriction endonuclease subunit S [Gillisia sp. JM1]|uniref:restriction endonuclease subunit S n=1 Tax=Gillisia sp. JM1 TaxID=1283286 RepID=UPI0018CAA950|nr:restriction endonuclease subunit S [Gillisia sp. JM1]